MTKDPFFPLLGLFLIILFITVYAITGPAVIIQINHEDDAFNIWYETLETEQTCLYETPTTPRYTIKTCAKPAYYPHIEKTS